MLCTQDAPLHFTESDNNQPNRKRSRETAHRLHDTANHGMMQSIRADGRYFTNQVSIDFPHLISSPFCPKISANPIRLEDVHSFIRETALTMANEIKFQKCIRGWCVLIQPLTSSRRQSIRFQHYHNSTRLTHLQFPYQKAQLEYLIQTLFCPKGEWKF